MSIQQTQPEPYPVNEAVTVLKGETIFKKDKKWWEAVLLVEVKYEGGSTRKVTWYRWIWSKITPRDGKEPYYGWKRKEHKNINFPSTWITARDLIEKLMVELK
jgi:hypothetical protein